MLEQKKERQKAQQGREFSREVGAQALRKIKARRNGSQGVWFGLGMMGLIGWSVVVPSLVGAALGTWMDSRHPGRHSWTLPLLIGGLSLGCLNAWLWVTKQDQAMREDPGKKRDEESETEKDDE